MYVLKHARGRTVYVTPYGNGITPDGAPTGPTLTGVVVDAEDGLLVRLESTDDVASGWFQIDLHALQAGYRMFGWGTQVEARVLRLTLRGQPEVLFQRSAARIPYQTRVGYTPLGGKAMTPVRHEGETTDLSLGGVGILGPEPAATRQKVRVEFPEPPLDNLGPLMAVVRWTGTAPPNDHGLRFRLGCHFEGMTDAQRATLRQVLARKARELTQQGSQAEAAAAGDRAPRPAPPAPRDAGGEPPGAEPADRTRRD